MLIGFRPDNINLIPNNENKNTSINNENGKIIIAIFNDKLSKENEYNALLNPKAITYGN